MSHKATVVAPSNIALIKYWGTRDLDQTLPFNPSFSMTLRECATRTTVETLEGAVADEVLVRGSDGGLQTASRAFAGGVVRHLDKLRAWAGAADRFRVATENSFPMGAGLASSASGFAALALAVVESLERDISPETASRLARQSGSGSAARSVMGGYVEWPAADREDGSATRCLRQSIGICGTWSRFWIRPRSVSPPGPDTSWPRPAPTSSIGSSSCPSG